MKNKISVTISHRYNVVPEKVYDSFLDPERAKKFMFATFTGKMIRSEIDAKVGGTFLFVDRRPTGDAAHYGRYLALERPKKIIFEFAMSKDAKDWDQVEIEISPLAKGCQVSLSHQISEDFAHLKSQVEMGWDNVLDSLGETLRT